MREADHSEDEFARAVEAIRPDRNLRHTRLREAAALLEQGRLTDALDLTRAFLAAHPQEVSALHLMAEIVTQLGNHQEAETLLAQGMLLAPHSTALRFAYTNVLLKMDKPQAALREAERLLEQEPDNPAFLPLRPLVFEALDDYPMAVALWRELTEDHPAGVACWLRYGYALRTVGAREECIAAFRHVIALNASLGEAYWALANLKTFRFTPDEIAQIEGLLSRTDLESRDRALLHFSLGKAYGDQKVYTTAFGHYAKGNALHRLAMQHDPDLTSRYVARCKAVFTPEFFREREGWGSASDAPIFIVGMLRSGSTLVEQVLASHSQVEGTRELTDLAAIAREIEQERAPGRTADLPGGIAKLDAVAAQRLGEQYLESVRARHKLGRPHFTDKMGANYIHIGLLQLTLPNAKIIDVRRHPLACGWSNFTQFYPTGHNFAYRLTDIARTYRDYVELMAHLDHVLPGKVHRVFYEALMVDPEQEIRRLMDYLELPFEEDCLHFHKTARAITTVSSEQVRNPIYCDANEEWRNYEPWLGPLQSSLGAVLARYPEPPPFEDS